LRVRKSGDTVQGIAAVHVGVRDVEDLAVEYIR
jgi:hypothetical protein